VTEATVDGAARGGVQPRRSAIDTAIGAFVLSGLSTTLAALVQGSPAEIGLVPILVALAGCCLAVLARRAAPSVAWIAAITGSYAASSIPIVLARAADPSLVGVSAWLGFAIPASIGAVTTLGIAAGYATRRERRMGPVAIVVSAVLLGWLIVACATTLWLVAVAHATSDPAFNWIDVASAPIGSFVPFVVVITGLGVAADLRDGVGRASEGLGSGLTRVGPAERAWTLAVATIQELVPGRAAAEEASLAAERTRLAGDLHAVVLPSLRQAIEEAEAGGDADSLARRLRTVDVELERLMADRWPVVLEAFGLVAALEELAERVETDGGPAVDLEIGAIDPERPPRHIERTAWRVAQVAVDNAVRHARATTISIVVAAGPADVRLAVADNGSGFDPAVARRGARGLRDATRRAAEVGATLTVGSRPGAGAIVEFSWTRSAR
jgi:signal transduction histidine kinase